MSHVVLTAKNFEEIVTAENKTVMVDFYADWCGPCKMLAPIIEEMAKEADESVVVAKLNVDDNEEIAVQFGVMTIPTVIVFKDGEPIEKVVGVVPKDQLLEMLKRANGE